MIFSEYDVTNMKVLIESREADWFAMDLARFIRKADSLTRRRLADAYPEEVLFIETMFDLDREMDRELEWLFERADFSNLHNLRSAFLMEYDMATRGLLGRRNAVVGSSGVEVL